MLRNHLAQPRGPLSAEALAALDLRTVRLLPSEREVADRLWGASPDNAMPFRFVEYGTESCTPRRGLMRLPDPVRGGTQRQIAVESPDPDAGPGAGHRPRPAGRRCSGATFRRSSLGVTVRWMSRGCGTSRSIA